MSGNAIDSWAIKDLGRATITTFNKAGEGTHTRQVRRVQVTAYDKQDELVACRILDEDAAATNEQVSAAVARLQEDMIRQHDNDQPEL